MKTYMNKNKVYVQMKIRFMYILFLHSTVFFKNVYVMLFFIHCTDT